MNAAEPRSDWLTRALPTVALVAFLFVAAPTEWSLATDVMKLHAVIAIGVPVTIDAYVLAAFRSGRDVPPAMTVMALSLAAATGAHIADAQAKDKAKATGLPSAELPLWATVTVTGVMLLILVVVLWRIHVISHPAVHRPETSTDRVENPESDRAEGVVRIEQIRTPEPIDPIAAIESTRSDTGSIRAVAAAIGSTRSVVTEPIDPIGPDPIRPARSTTRPDRAPGDRPLPDRGTSADRTPPAWTTRSALGPRGGRGRSLAELLADLSAALGPDDPIPSATALRDHYGIGAPRDRELREAIKTDRQQQAAGGVEGKIN